MRGLSTELPMNPTKKNSPVNWAELDANTLRTICKHLPTIFDFIKIRAVCKNWHSSTDPSYLAPQFPLLLEGHSGRRDSQLEAFSLHTHKLYAINIPEIRGKHVSGPSCGYLLMYRSGKTPSVSLLNPFTGSQLRPRFTRFDFFRAVSLGPNPIRKIGDGVIYMGGKEARPNGEVVNYVGYWDPEIKKWTSVEVPYGSAMAYYKERLYLYDGDYCKTQVIDISSGAVELNILNPGNVFFSDLIVTPRGLLGVDRHFPVSGGRMGMGGCDFTVYRLEDEDDDDEPHWVKMSDIGDLMLFIDCSNGICASAADFDGFAGNCIYFLRSNHKTGDKSRTYVGRYDLGKGRTEVVACVRAGSVWVVPSLS